MNALQFAKRWYGNPETEDDELAIQGLAREIEKYFISKDDVNTVDGLSMSTTKDGLQTIQLGTGNTIKGVSITNS